MVLNDDLTGGSIISNGVIDISNAEARYCPKCDARTELYQLTYTRECDGPECIGTDSTIKSFEKIFVKCNSMPPCEWKDWIVQLECPKVCNTDGNKISIRDCSGEYCKPEGDLQITNTKTEQCPVIPCGNYKTIYIYSMNVFSRMEPMGIMEFL